MAIMATFNGTKIFRPGSYGGMALMPEAECVRSLGLLLEKLGLHSRLNHETCNNMAMRNITIEKLLEIRLNEFLANSVLETKMVERMRIVEANARSTWLASRVRWSPMSFYNGIKIVYAMRLLELLSKLGVAEAKYAQTALHHREDQAVS